jgi:phage shock protein A
LSLLHRLRDVMAEKASVQLQHVENPEEALDYSYERLLDNLQKARRAVADALTAEKGLELHADQLRQDQARVNDEALHAVKAGREDLARLALTRAQGLQAQIGGLEQQIPQLQQQEQHLEEVARRLQAKVETFRAQKDTIKAQYSVAEAAARIDESVSGLSEEMADVDRIVQRAQDRTAQMQARSAAVDQLIAGGSLDAIGAPGGMDDIERQLTAHEGQAAVDAQLAALKAEIGQGNQPASSLPAAPVVIRIQGEGQYLLPATRRARLDEFDQQLLHAVETGDEPTFRSTLSAALEFVRSAGERLGDDHVRPSEIVLPPQTMTLLEAQRLLEQPQTAVTASPDDRGN